MKNFYYEFNEHDYYALIAVSIEESDLYTNPEKKAAVIYSENVAGDSAEEVLMEGIPVLKTKEYAFMKFVYAPNHECDEVKVLIKQFEEIDSGLLIIDGSLI